MHDLPTSLDLGNVWHHSASLSASGAPDYCGYIAQVRGATGMGASASFYYTHAPKAASGYRGCHNEQFR